MAHEKLENILRHVAETEDIRNYEIYPHIDALRGDGFLSECYTGEIVNKDTKSKIQSFIKISLPFLGTFTSFAYCNEYHFYTSIFPELNKYQMAKGVKNPFQNIPKFYCGDDKGDKKYIAVENLTIQNYFMSDKTQNLNKDHLKLLFEIYGKFHALSFAFKEHNYEKYLELTKPLRDLLIGKEVVHIIGAAKRVFNKAYNAVEEIDIDISKKIDSVNENFEETFVNATTYNGKYSGFCHGDCWSNNMLFKNGENGQIEDIKMIDFQLCRDSTPIHDLSYFFYSGGSKEDFNKLDEYLELYHKSFSAFAKELGSDPEILLPLSILKSEWKKWSFFGISMGILLWQTKLINKDAIGELSVTGQINRDTINAILQSDVFKTNTSNILLHAVEYGII